MTTSNNGFWILFLGVLTMISGCAYNPNFPTKTTPPTPEEVTRADEKGIVFSVKGNAFWKTIQPLEEAAARHCVNYGKKSQKAAKGHMGTDKGTIITATFDCI